MVKKPSLWQRLFGQKQLQLADDSAIEDASNPNAVILHTSPIGSSGTYSFAGYPSEEYLTTLRGRPGADLIDKMRRNEPQIKMVLSAVKNVIKAANWEVEPADDSDEAKEMAEFIEHVLFHDTDKSWRQFLTEALTCIEFGHSVFEKTHKIVSDHPRFGSYTGIRSLGLRGARTLERFHLDPDTGKLTKVAQYAYGDLHRTVDIPAEFLLVFSMDKEGDNYEGISMLRACYGPWLRKQTYKKLMAIGIEKHAVPTPTLEVPEGKENSQQYSNAIAALQVYVSHESNYITMPSGWKISYQDNKFDPERVQKAIDAEDKEMVKAFLANFLELGMSNSGGSYALAFNQSDFFLGSIVHIAHMIEEGVNEAVVKELIDMNYGPQDKYPALKHSGIEDRGGRELAEVMRFLCDSKAIIPDDDLENHIRKRFKFPDKSKKGQRFGGQTDGGTPQHPEASGGSAAAKGEGGGSGSGDPATGGGGGDYRNGERMRLAEKKAQQQITQGKAMVKQVMLDGLKPIGQDIVRQIMGKVRRLPESQQLDAIKNLKPAGRAEYKARLRDTLALIATQALAQARREVPKAKGVKLSESEGNLRLAEFDRLPPKVKAKVQTQTDLLVDSQTADLEKYTYFQFSHSVDSTDSDSILEADVSSAVDDYLDGPSVEAASGNSTAHVVNETRKAFFFDDEVLKEIEAFDFVNGDPVSPICQDLAGTTFAKDDPEAERYFPPLHHNCKSYIVPVLSGVNQDDIGPLKPSDPSLDEYVTLSEHKCHDHA